MTSAGSRHPAWELGLYGLVPLLATGWLLHLVYGGGIDAVDFRHDFWIAGLRVLHGADPYAWSRAQIAAGLTFPYPAVAALLFAPFALLPSAAGGGVFTALCLASVPAAIRLAGVRDWRVYGVALLWAPVVQGWQSTNVTLPLAVGVAAVWRVRDRPVPAGLLVALLVSIKPMLFPLGLWLLGTRRWTATGCALIGAAVLNAAAWGIIGPVELPRFLHLITTQVVAHVQGYSLGAVAAQFGLVPAWGTVGEVAAGALATLALLVLAWRGRELAALVLAVAVSIVASPQVDGHYLALLLVPLALARPRLGPLWFAPLALWACPVTEASGWQQVVWWSVLAGLVAALVRSVPGEAGAVQPSALPVPPRRTSRRAPISPAL